MVFAIFERASMVFASETRQDLGHFQIYSDLRSILYAKVSFPMSSCLYPKSILNFCGTILVAKTAAMALPAVAELNDILATVPINGDYNLQAPNCMCYTGGPVRCRLLTNGADKRRTK